MAAIFISYRESDAKAWAIALRDELASSLGEAAVFFDKDMLQAGPWNAQLQQAVQQCQVLLLVMGSHWLDAADAEGRQRLLNEDDVHRRELVLALATPGVTVLPVLVDGAGMPAATVLPTALVGLAALQALAWGEQAVHRASDRRRLLVELQRLTGLRAVGMARPGWAVASVLASALTMAAAVAASMASVALSAPELAVLWVCLLGLCQGGRLLWHRGQAHGRT